MAHLWRMVQVIWPIPRNRALSEGIWPCRSRSSSGARPSRACAFVPEWASRLRADQARQLRDRLRRRAGCDLRQFRLLRCRPRAARRRRLVEPAAMAAAGSGNDAARRAPARRADDHRLGGRHRQQQPRRSVRRDDPRHRREAPPAEVPPGLFLFGDRGGGIAAPHARRRGCRRARRAGAARSRDARCYQPNRRGRRSPPLYQTARCRRRRDHRRAQQRLRDLRGAGDPPRLSAGAGLFRRQDSGMRLVLCRALRREGVGAWRDHDG